jgi:hypothetical protein
VSSGKWYWEATKTGTAYGNLGVVLTPFNMAASSSLDLGGLSNEYVYVNSGSKFNNNSSSAYGASWTNNDVIGVALDLDAGTLVFYKNGSSQGTAFSSLPSGIYLVGGYDSFNGSGFVFNFGQRAFAYTAPSGFKALCTTNLPTPTIGATSTTQANDYMNVVLYSGNSSTQNITGVGFAPDFTWLKVRNDAQNHRLFDTVRGANKRLMSSSTAAEATTTDELTAFGSDGFTLGANTDVNGTGFNYVAWNWNAGGSNATNTSGTITSTVRANTTSGFSIATFTTPSSFTNATVGHGLGAAPSMIIVRKRTTSDWITWHTSIGTNGYLTLNTTNQSSSNSGAFNGTSSTTWTMGSSSWWQAAAADWICYSFAPVAGYSAFGSYTGNGSTDGPFVYTNFRPRFVMFKRTDSTSNWVILDTSRSISNQVSKYLIPNSSGAEGDDGTVSGSWQADFLSNGFKLKATGENTVNPNGGTIVYAAFAETPAKFSLAR